MEKSPVFDAILARRSIRTFQDKAVEREKITVLLHAAMAAPSACNLQPWSFIVVDEPDILRKMESAISWGYKAPLLIVMCGEHKHIPWDGDAWQFDCGAAAQNIMLEAIELSLSSVCIGGFDEEKLREILDIPDDVQPVCIIEIGYPGCYRKPHSWYTEEAVHWQKYDKAKSRTMRTMQMLQDDIKSGLI